MGVVSKKASGERSILFSAALNIRKPATKPPALSENKLFIDKAGDKELTRK